MDSKGSSRLGAALEHLDLSFWETSSSKAFLVLRSSAFSTPVSVAPVLLRGKSLAGVPGRLGASVAGWPELSKLGKTSAPRSFEVPWICPRAEHTGLQAQGPGAISCCLRSAASPLSL